MGTTTVLDAISPDGIPLKTWADAVALTLWNLSPMPTIMREEDWRTWALTALTVAGSNGIVVPDPYQFDDWREWARRFNEVIDGKELS